MGVDAIIPSQWARECAFHRFVPERGWGVRAARSSAWIDPNDGRQMFVAILLFTTN